MRRALQVLAGLARDAAAEPQNAAPGGATDAVPFPGAAPYGEEHAPFFEGRVADCTALLAQLRQPSAVPA